MEPQPERAPRPLEPEPLPWLEPALKLPEPPLEPGPLPLEPPGPLPP